MSNIVLSNVAELTAIGETKAEQIKKTFEPMIKMLEEFEAQFNEVVEESKKGITKELTAKAKRIRLDIGKVRIETGKLKDKQKEYIKLEDRAIMGVHNIVVWAVTEKEDILKEIETYFETQERIRLEKLQSDRVIQLSEFLSDANERNLSSMDEDVWNAYLLVKKKEYEDRIEAEKQAIIDRIKREKEEATERERIRLENIKLREEAEAREKQLKIEQDERNKQEKIRLAKEEAERKAYEAKLKVEREAREKVEREEKAKREALEAQIKAKEEAEKKAKEEAENKLQAELAKGDIEKINDLVNDLTSLKSKYEFKSAQNKKKYKDAGILIDKTINFIKG